MGNAICSYKEKKSQGTENLKLDFLFQFLH